MKTIRETPPSPTCWALVHDADGATVIGQVLGTPACGGYWCHSACNFDPLNGGIGVQN
jgi:hypothetical protein